MMVENTKNGRKSMKQESDSLKRIDFESAYDLIAPPNSLSMFMSVKSSHMWDVKLAPSRKNQVGSYFVPKISLGRRKARRITIEVVHPRNSLPCSNTNEVIPGFGAENSDECPEFGNNLMLELLSGSKPSSTDIECNLLPDEKVVMRVFKTEEKEKKYSSMKIVTRKNSLMGYFKENGHLLDDASLSTMGLFGVQDNIDHNSWVEECCYSIEDIEIVSRIKNIVAVWLIEGNKKVRRLIIFNSGNESRSFFELVVNFQRSKNINENNLIGEDMSEIYDSFNILVDICSLWDLRFKSSDRQNMNIFCVIQFDKNQVHETDTLSYTSELIWTVKTGSLFLFSTTHKELRASTTGLTFEILSKDHLDNTFSIGSISLPYETLSKSLGNRMELDITNNGTITGTLAVRLREATEEDTHFMNSFQAGYDPRNFLYPSHIPPTFTPKPSEFLSKHKKGKNGSLIKLKNVRPSPDPTRPLETEFLSSSSIDQEVIKPSRTWIHAGSGDLGRVFVEVISCDKLKGIPRDSGKLDAFVSIVYEDAFVNTDIIYECNSPRWLPWTKRAFIFNMLHSSSQINIGVLNFREIELVENEPIGRICVNLTNFSPNVEYVLNYTLHNSSGEHDRIATGLITLRIRIEIENMRKILMASFKHPQTQIINVDRKLDFAVLKYVVEGIKGTKKSNDTTLRSHLNEIYSYKPVIDVVKEEFLNIIFWRGTYHFSIPIHSMIAFVLGIILLEYPSLTPSAIFGFLAWILVSTQSVRQKTLNQWDKPKSFWQLTKQIIIGSIEPQYIPKGESTANLKFEDFVIEDAVNNHEQTQVSDRSHDQTYFVEEEDDPIDGYEKDVIIYDLEQICQYLRMLRSIYMWDETHFSFFLTLFLVFLSVTLAFTTISWTSIFFWFSKIITWVFLGPWMWFVGRFLGYNVTDSSRAPVATMKKSSRKTKNREVNENKQKLADMKGFLFGCYVQRVDLSRRNRHKDIPLTSSSANAYNPTKNSFQHTLNIEPLRVEARLLGQQISLDMIPNLIDQNFSSFDSDAIETDNDTSSDRNGSIADSQVSDETVKIRTYGAISSVEYSA